VRGTQERARVARSPLSPLPLSVSELRPRTLERER
jgi:hypothetical protein